MTTERRAIRRAMLARIRHALHDLAVALDLADALTDAAPPTCKSYGPAREDGERQATHTGHEGIDDG
jgi:hypothetical protein